jgi:excisionase family DNA binding protein
MLSVKAAAQRFGVSPSLLYQLVARRAIDHYRVGGKIVFAEGDLDAYLVRCRITADRASVSPPRVSTRRVKLRHISLAPAKSRDT